MKSCTGLILIMLGLFLKASSGGNSTQVYYIELHIEAEAYSSVTKLLNGLTLDMNNFTVINISQTTECNSLTSGQVNCTCYSGCSWSDEVCKNYTHCCNQNHCTFAVQNPRAMCLSEDRVLVNGLFTVQKLFNIGLADTTSDMYVTTVQNYTNKLESVYSTLGWFDSLKITGLREGSITGNFVMLLTARFEVAQLDITTSSLEKDMNASFSLRVTGFTSIPELQAPIPYNNVTNITCSTPAKLQNPTWSFQQNAPLTLNITNGTEANVTYNIHSTTVSINKSTEFWKGTFTCDYQSIMVESIIYTASLYLDIALLPQIIIISDPQFPDCRKGVDQFDIKVHCMVPNTTENYTVTWTETNSEYEKDEVSSQNGLVSYSISAVMPCSSSTLFNVTCVFWNRLNQSTSATLSVPTIQDNSVICEKDSDWPDTVATYTAINLCGPATVGLQKRTCLLNQSKGTWDTVKSECVNDDLSSLLIDAMNLQRGLGYVEDFASNIFSRLKQSTEQKNISTFPNINASVAILNTMLNATNIQNPTWNKTQFPFQDFVKSSSNLLNGSLNDSWKPVGSDGIYTLPVKYLLSIEGIIQQTNLIATSPDMSQLKQDNIQIIINNSTDPSTPLEFNTDFSATVTYISNISVQAALKNLDSKLPNNVKNTTVNYSGVVLLVVADSRTNISMWFNITRLPNHQMYCVFWNFSESQWSSDGCTWGGADNPGVCKCNHLSSFTILMSKDPIDLLYSEQLTYAGLGCSIGSLALCLFIEFLVWNTVVKTNIAHFRHTVLVNIMVSLLIADCSFLAAPTPSSTPSNWCLSLTVMKHFGYLAVFFWMLCLSLGLLHQIIFVFVHLRKKVYLGLCIFLGYVCPLVIVVITFITFNNGSKGSYYNAKTCWLIYESALTGSIHAFVFPVFVIVFVNMFTMVVVISRILKPTLSEGRTHDEKDIIRSIIKTVVLLTPTLGITWIFGLFVLMLDLTVKPYAQIVNYAFIFFNSFQGFFILLTACLGEKKVRDVLLKRITPQQSKNYRSESSTRITPTTKKK